MQYRSLFSALALTAAMLPASASLTSAQDLNRPFGWATCSSLTSANDFNVTGGQAVAQPRTITLTSNGQDMRQAILDAVAQNDIIVFDGAAGPFTVSTSMRFNDLRDKTIVGINQAQICTQFVLTPAIHQLMADKEVLKASTTGTKEGFTLSNGAHMSEEREYLIRQSLIDYMNDPKEDFRHAGLFGFNNCENIILRNLSLVGPGAIDVGGDDLLTISRGSKHIWVDHVDFCDGMDGNFDINSFSDFITVSWCIFHYTERTFIHANTNLIGSNDRPESNGVDNLNVTFAFCEWGPGCDQRMPMVRFGTIHLLNNYYNCAGNSAAVNPRFGSEFLIEGNYFEQGVKKIFHYRDPKAYVFRDNHYTEDFKQPADLGTVSIPYTYKALPVKKVAKKVGSQVGATLKNPLKISK